MPAEGPKGAPLRVRPGMETDLEGTEPTGFLPVPGYLFRADKDGVVRLSRDPNHPLDVLPLLPPSDET
jgi:hypothetical protein